MTDKNRLIQFLTTNERNAWIEPIEGLELYVRKFARHTLQEVDLANMNANPPGQGKLTAYLPEFEKLCKQYGAKIINVENIHNERLISFFSRQGYKLSHLGGVPQMKKEL